MTIVRTRLFVVIGFAGMIAYGAAPLRAADCNHNGIDDVQDIDPSDPDGNGSVSSDCDNDGIPDECENAPSFDESGVFNVESAGFVHAADLNGDGRPDILASTLLSHEINWYANLDGFGGFGRKRLLANDLYGPYSLFAADLDGDGDNDLLVAYEYDADIVWYENLDGAGNFGASQVVTQFVTSARTAIAADIDGDGDLDVVSASYFDDRIAWYENTDGLGHFGPHRIISDSADGAQSAYAADIDGDGDLDVVSASSLDDKVAWYQNLDGAGTFGPQLVISTSAVRATTAHPADIDGDGDLDVIAASGGDANIAWYENTNGLGAFGPRIVISDTLSGAWALDAADVDGDGDTDVLTASVYNDTLAWFENLDGAGDFSSAHIISNQLPRVRSVFAVDLSGDGDIDVLSASPDDDAVRWYRNIGDDCDHNGIPDRCEPQEDCNGNGIYDICESQADCNGNGIQDICELTGNDCNHNQVLDECESEDDCDGNGIPDTCEFEDNDCNENGIPDTCELAGNDCNNDRIPDDCELENNDCNDNHVPDDCEPQDDCDGDGVQDICELAGNDCNSDGIPDNCQLDGNDCNGNGLPDECEPRLGFVAHTVDDAVAGARWVFATDIDSDGDIDIVAASEDDDKVAWYENLDGDGTFGSPHVITTDAVGARFVYGADLDGDGDPDVLSASASDSKVAWYQNTDGQGTFGPQRVISAITGEPSSVYAADFDGDGDLDVLSTATYGNNDVAWYQNLNGAGAFSSAHLIHDSSGATWMGIAADLDSDGDMDVVAVSWFPNNKIAWYPNLNGHGSFGDQRVISIDTNGPLSIVAYDFDHDGDTDILSASLHNDLIVWHENPLGDGDIWLMHPIASDIDGAQSVQLADFDRDGSLDVVAASRSDDKITWYSNRHDSGHFGAQQLIADNAGNAMSVVTADVNGDGYVDVVSAAFNNNAIVWYENHDLDCNRNGIPDECETENDCNHNGVPDDCELAGHDCNGNGIHDRCEQDRDHDRRIDDCDNCPDTFNFRQTDRDGDGVGDACDNCRDVPNPDQADSDNDGVGDACNVEVGVDMDGDGSVDGRDIARFVKQLLGK